MSAAELLLDLARRGIRLEAHGERLRYFPRSAVTPDLLDRLKAHKGELLAMLRPATEPLPNGEIGQNRTPIKEKHAPAKPVCRCGSTTWRDVVLHHAPHNGTTVRRDCGRCGRFMEFPVWYGKDTRQKE